MAKGLVVNVVAEAERYTEVFSHEQIRIGAGADCDLLITHPDFRNFGLVLLIQRVNGAYEAQLCNKNLRLTHNDEPLESWATISDGDIIALPEASFTLHFFPLSGIALANTKGPFALSGHIPSLDKARSDEAKAFLREFTRELLREISPLAKILTVIVLAAIFGSLGYLLYSFNRELKRSQGAAETAQQEAKGLRDEIKAMNDKLESIGVKTGDLVSSASLPYKVRNDFGNGVCLIYGLYHYVDRKTGKPLRFPQAGQEMSMEGEELRPYITDGAGPIAEFEVIGTGFHVGEGFILTNRHVLQPWSEEQQAKQLKSLDAIARMKRLIVYFPDRPQPLTLNFRLAALQEDVAVGQIDKLPPEVPVLPLDSDSESVAVGRIVTLIGYPNGPNRLIAKMEEPEQQVLQKRCGGTQGSLVGCLAEKNLIKPLTTPGTVTDKDIKRIVYDARTAEGGSGSPLFGQTGRVIGINFGVFAENEASNFAVPITFGRQLLQRAGWGAKKVVATNNTNTNPVANANLTH